MMVYPRIGMSYGEWLNRKYDPCDEEHHDLTGNVQHFSEFATRAGLKDSGILVMAVTDEVVLVAGSPGCEPDFQYKSTWTVSYNLFISLYLNLPIIRTFHTHFRVELSPKRCFQVGNREFCQILR